MDKINSVTIVGGTHGNEYSGIYLLRKWQKSSAAIQREGLTVDTLFANTSAFENNKRYLDCDLNRQFTHERLNDRTLSNYEESRAKVINAQIGPKGAAKSDFIIDLHNTTSNMGPSLILLQSDAFNVKMAAYVKQHMPEAVIIMEDQIPMDEQPYLCSITKQGVIVEVGPQPQSVIRQDVLEWMETLTTHILDYLELYNADKLPALPASVEVYEYTETLTLPMDEHGERIGMVHRNVQDQDFKALNPGDPIIALFDGGEICWEGDYVAYPHFINEAAYYDNNLAMSLAKKRVLEVP
ncbi:aspartoacylase [Paraneptunicella aestuarii]|uniref:aspartoacylase n=1 Tax=Paraneptunicella aestuarii TaxID=2831148 RepID=UPI001E43E27D|nr:aspartoacylase [Paraneptunicella aestuarii]UAA39003.1 aspartoacylase [Paraneptunicella aestuarii]